MLLHINHAHHDTMLEGIFNDQVRICIRRVLVFILMMDTCQSVSQSDVYYSLYDIIANKIHMQHYCGMQHYGSIYGYAQSTFSQINLATR